jgi:acyl CoA:acetate/3-ketoacid CoA transferase alpha subunit
VTLKNKKNATSSFFWTQNGEGVTKTRAIADQNFVHQQFCDENGNVSFENKYTQEQAVVLAKCILAFYGLIQEKLPDSSQSTTES